jgi:hypothetical protein
MSLSRPWTPDLGPVGKAITRAQQLIDAHSGSTSVLIKNKNNDSAAAEAEEEEIEEEITADITKPCPCKGFCLKKLMTEGKHNYGKAVEKISTARKEVTQSGYNTKAETKETMRTKFAATIVGTSDTGRNIHNFSFGGVDNMCRDAWATVYGVKPGMLDTLSAELKRGSYSFNI